MMSKCSFIALYIISSLLFRDDHYDTSFVVPDEECVCFLLFRAILIHYNFSSEDEPDNRPEVMKTPKAK